MTPVQSARDLDDYTAAYDSLPFEAVAASHRRRRVLASVRGRRPGRVLELGCGRAPLFLDLPGVAVTVLEPSAGFAARARELAAGRDDVVVIEARAEHVSAEQLRGGFDVVVVSSLLHEVPDPAAVLAAAVRWCRPGGAVHVNTPSAGSLHRRLGTSMGLIRSSTALTALGQRLQQHRVFSRQDLVDLVEQAGLKVVAGGGILVKPFSHAQMQRALDAGIIDEAVLDGLDRWADEEPDLASEVWLDAEVPRA